MSTELDIFKVWVFYLKESPDRVYAYTMVKEYKKRFLQERESDSFIVDKIEMDELEFALFSNENRNMMLHEASIGVGVDGPVLSLIMTNMEEDRLYVFANQVDNEMNQLYHDLQQYPLKKKIRKELNKIFDISTVRKMPDGSEIVVSRFDLLRGLAHVIKSF